LRMLMICSSLNLVLRIKSSPRSVILRENSHYHCTSFRGGGQVFPTPAGPVSGNPPATAGYSAAGLKA
jgi:hypothetical protein